MATSNTTSTPVATPSEKQTAAVFFASQQQQQQQQQQQLQQQDQAQLASAFFDNLPQSQHQQQQYLQQDPVSRMQIAQGSSASLLFDEQATPPHQTYEDQQHLHQHRSQQQQLTVPNVMYQHVEVSQQQQQPPHQQQQVMQTEPSPSRDTNSSFQMLSGAGSRAQGGQQFFGGEEQAREPAQSFRVQHKPASSLSAMFGDPPASSQNNTTNQTTSTLGGGVQRQETEPNIPSSSLSKMGHNQASLLVSPKHHISSSRQNMFGNASNQTVGKVTADSVPTGFIQAYPSSKPPQSVASVNFSTMMEDSESLIRAYKKKKTELEQLRDQFYQTETQLFTVSQQHVIMEEENSSLKNRVAELERMLKDSQMREIRRESADAMSQQLAIKTKEVEMYQQEVSHQKAINQRLQEKMKELVMRKSNFSNQSAAHSAAQRDKMQSSQPEIAHSDL